ncbi:hypothetical protein EXIGLDRAFT_766826 [Exidia glandulosa HHB12029]|uniref:Uncharacterized protein n=1 Tax=Exidia glandulosa HHB12029 TaxID=1314781 RepID=A0A165JGC3_EXIGL|nr:hypothetical protein EXIGLDRAFT_766826 [Exidia glandulosa HHB12029]
MSHLPVELVRDIVDCSTQHSMVSDARWAGQSLAIVSRAVYTWVAPILFESWYITPAKLDLFNELVSSGKLPSFAYARTFIADDRDHPIWKTATRCTFLADLDCSKLQVVSGADIIFQQLCITPQFRHRVVHLPPCSMTYLSIPHDTLQSVFSRVTHICTTYSGVQMGL